MSTNAPGWRPIRHWFFCACLLVLALTGISGCASKMSAAGPAGSGVEVVTDSDEPEFRKRARIRLELAVGYFEQGQTTIALDELKQSMAADPNYACLLYTSPSPRD